MKAITRQDKIIQDLGLQNKATVHQFPVEIYGQPESVKYEGDGNTYNGYKHEAVILTGARHEETSDIHNTEALGVGLYWLVLEVKGKGKIKIRHQYYRDEEESLKLMSNPDSYKPPSIYEVLNKEADTTVDKLASSSSPSSATKK